MKTLLIATALMSMAQGAERNLTITVYDKAHLDAATREEVFTVLQKIMKSAGVHLTVVSGDLGSPEASLWMKCPLQPNFARVCEARDGIALEIAAHSPLSKKSTVLGMAQPFAPAGLNVSVFNDRVQRVAAIWNKSHAVLLAYAIAHEVGHVLLRSREHTRYGMMAELWDYHDYDWMKINGLFFTREQSNRMSATLAGFTLSER